ncbi:hypothetical protein BDQ17DRAFT_682257 [Cyathus striatus]|nr:hypothetical protein BDQ17DRAFT_682257 [Cyathus striatus]
MATSIVGTLTPDLGYRLALPPPCKKCGYLTGILDSIPSPNTPISLLRSDYVPSSQDYNGIQETVFSSEAFIRTLEAEICKSQLAIQRLQLRITSISHQYVIYLTSFYKKYSVLYAAILLIYVMNTVVFGTCSGLYTLEGRGEEHTITMVFIWDEQNAGG